MELERLYDVAESTSTQLISLLLNNYNKTVINPIQWVGYSHFHQLQLIIETITRRFQNTGKQLKKQNKTNELTSIRVKQCEQKIHYHFSLVSAVRIAPLPQ